MPKFHVHVPHTLSAEEARHRLEKFAGILRQKFQDSVSDLDQLWEGDTLQFKFTAYGIPIQGGIAVTDTALQVAGDLPLTAMLFKGRIESAIQEQLAGLVGRSG
jgi:hypothetical protein